MQQALQKIPAGVRASLYVGWGVVTLGMQAWAAWFSSVGDPVPELILRLTGVVSLIGAAFLFTAAGNTEVVDKSGGNPTDVEDNLYDLEEAEYVTEDSELGK